MNKLELKIPPVVVVLVCLLLMWLFTSALPNLTIDFPFQRPLAWLLAATGGLIGVVGVLTFRQAKTSIDPHAPQKASTLVTHGIYRFTRNPMYLGLFLFLLAWAVRTAHPLTLLVLPLYLLYMNRFQISVEERLLRQKFGQTFVTYSQQVRRWL